MRTQIWLTHNQIRFCGEAPVRACVNKGKHIRLVDNVVVCVKLIRSKCSLYSCGLYTFLRAYLFPFSRLSSTRFFLLRLRLSKMPLESNLTNE